MLDIFYQIFNIAISTLINKGKIMNVQVDIRQGNGKNNGSVYVTIGNWVVYLDNSTGEQIVEILSEKDKEAI
jgi:hypothetical protein